MSKPDSGFDYDRYRKLLAEADDEPKRVALIELLVVEGARAKLAAQRSGIGRAPISDLLKKPPGRL
jgi:transposase